jgi:hypothetical protein
VPDKRQFSITCETRLARQTPACTSFTKLRTTCVWRNGSLCWLHWQINLLVAQVKRALDALVTRNQRCMWKSTQCFVHCRSLNQQILILQDLCVLKKKKK